MARSKKSTWKNIIHLNLVMQKRATCATVSLFIEAFWFSVSTNIHSHLADLVSFHIFKLVIAQLSVI